MMNSSSPSRARLANGAAIVLAAAAAVLGVLKAPAWMPGVASLAVIGALAYAIWEQTRLARILKEAAEVCARTTSGDLEARILLQRDGGDVGRLQKSINDMLDIVDAYVRESGASMEYASRGKTFRKVLERGLPGSFKIGRAHV